jgi:hypothetical protein
MPDGVLRLLDGDDLHERIGLALLLVTNGRDGFPHLAVISMGEVLPPANAR